MSKETKINHQPKPEPIKIGTSRRTYATAYANRPPTKRMDTWSWKMVIHSDDVEKNSVSLGRLAIRDVRKKMEQVYKEQQPQVYANEVEKQSFVDLMEMWYLDVVVPRLPDAKIRDEFKLSKRTVLNYQQGIKNLGKVAKDLLVSELNEKSAQDLVRGLQLKYAPRTVQLHATTLRQILLWAWKKQKIDVQITVVTKRPKGEKGYVNNRHTPTDADVEKLLASLRMCSLKKMVYIGWKTGARTGEICDLTWGDVYKNASGYWIRVSGKTGTRKCPITEEVYSEIRGFMRDSDNDQDRLFTASFRSNCSPQLRKSCEIRGIEPFTVYGLRRLRVDTLQRQGIETAVYERIMGHSIRMAQEIYRTTNDADLQGILNVKLKLEPQSVSKDVVSTLIEKLGLSLEEVLMRLLG